VQATSSFRRSFICSLAFSMRPLRTPRNVKTCCGHGGGRVCKTRAASPQLLFKHVAGCIWMSASYCVMFHHNPALKSGVLTRDRAIPEKCICMQSTRTLGTWSPHPPRSLRIQHTKAHPSINMKMWDRRITANQRAHDEV
jgi:hypothetical protein